MQATFTKAPYGTPSERRGALQGFMTCTECGCRITFDPKTKKSGIVHLYYRCANGHRVHKTRLHVTEEKILEGFERAIADITMPDVLADEISRVLRETHDVYRQERRREVLKLKKALEDVQARDDKIVNMLIDGKLDEATCRRQRQLAQAEQLALVDKLGAASEELDDRYLITADRIFELAKRASSLWKKQAPEQKRKLLELVVSNPRLDGSSVRYEMKKPFEILSEISKGDSWRARSDSNARPSDS